MLLDPVRAHFPSAVDHGIDPDREPPLGVELSVEFDRLGRGGSVVDRRETVAEHVGGGDAEVGQPVGVGPRRDDVDCPTMSEDRREREIQDGRMRDMALSRKMPVGEPSDPRKMVPPSTTSGSLPARVMTVGETQ